MLNVQTNVALSRRIRNITAYSLCNLHARHSLRSCHPGQASRSLYRVSSTASAKLQLRRPMISVDSHSGQPAHAQQPRQQQQQQR